MIKEFCLAWEKNKGKLEDYFKKTPQGNYADYEELVKLMFDIVINPYMKHDRNRFDTESIAVIDDGDYQGTCLFLLHQDVYQPLATNYVYTSVSYGSCSGCDTLQGIHGYSYDIPTEDQVKDYMTLCLHLLEGCHFMHDEEDEIKEFDSFSLGGNENHPEDGYLLCFYDEDEDGTEFNNYTIRLSRRKMESLYKMLKKVATD